MRRRAGGGGGHECGRQNGKSVCTVARMEKCLHGNPIAKILIFRESVIRFAQERVSKTADLLDFPLRLPGKCEGKSSKS